ncbi:MAG: tripartite tricarboxylate transporter substrate binding protein [Betaproteobacteria bacterium]|nr:tripartite tricarboxylate transporter substrate binding protein [Betaproteobacteria bacterium]
MRTAAPPHGAAGRLAGAALLAALALLPGTAAAQYPDKSIRLVVPFPAGGGADNLARIIMPRVAQALGKPIVIDNRPGAGGNVGAELVARAAPDGYTLLYGTNGTHSINQTLYGSLRFDPVKDFAPVSRMTLIAALLIVHPEFPVQSVSDLVRYARANPGKVNFASAGNGTTSHLAGELFKTMAGVDIVHVPYRGGALAAADVMSGQVSMMIDVMPNAYPLTKGGRVRGIAVTTTRRAATAPGSRRSPNPGCPATKVSAWDGILAPAGTPAPIVDRLNAAIREALDDPQVGDAARGRPADRRLAGRLRPSHRRRHRALGEGCPPVGRQDRLKSRGARSGAADSPPSPSATTPRPP